MKFNGLDFAPFDLSITEFGLSHIMHNISLIGGEEVGEYNIEIFLIGVILVLLIKHCCVFVEFHYLMALFLIEEAQSVDLIDIIHLLVFKQHVLLLW